MAAPIYTRDQLSGAFHLRYTWTGWPLAGNCFPERLDDEFFNELDENWQADNMRRLTTNWQRDRIQLVFSTVPQVSPIFFVGRTKGRLQHALRAAGTPVKFSRKVAFRGIGDNVAEQINRYVAQQVNRERFADPRFVERLKQLTRVGDQRRFAQPQASNSGRYWYNLHVVLVSSGRGKIESFDELRRLDAAIDGTAQKHGYDAVTRAWLLDHLHLALRGNIAESPLDIAWALMNNTAFAVGRNAVWQRGFYAGTFSEYDMNAVR